MSFTMSGKNILVEKHAVEASDECQLDLFGWERIKLGEGYAALARLELDRAASIFGDQTREKPGFADAAQGHAMAVEWGDALWALESHKHEAAAVFLWEKIRSYPFGQWGEGLRKALIKKMIAIIGQDADFYFPPGLCLGLLYFEVAEYEQAERSLRQLLKKHPNNVRFLCRLGDSLFLQRRVSEARYIYAQALLMAPAEVDPSVLEDREVRDIVKEHGAMMAPVFGWLEDVLPPVDCRDIRSDDQEHEKALMIYRTIVLAEKARRNGDHAGMVEQRRFLKETAPEILEAYLTRIA